MLDGELGGLSERLSIATGGGAGRRGRAVSRDLPLYCAEPTLLSTLRRDDVEEGDLWYEGDGEDCDENVQADPDVPGRVEARGEWCTLAGTWCESSCVTGNRSEPSDGLA